MKKRCLALLLVFSLYSPFGLLAQEKDRPVGKPARVTEPESSPPPKPQATPTPAPTPKPDKDRPIGPPGRGTESGPISTPTPKPKPRPAPTPDDTPDPTPSPTPDSGPSPEALRRAAELGRSDGSSDGAREGLDTGADEGRRRGQRDGRNKGFMWCEQEEQRRNYDNGYNAGFDSGRRNGASEGEREGLRDGEQKGEAEGEKDGVAEAQREARQTETDRGRARGVQQADAQTASIQARAQREGVAAGAKEAANRAREEDYQKGRSDYRKSQFQLRPLFSESFSLVEGNRATSRLQFPSDDNQLWVYSLAQTPFASSNHAAILQTQNPTQDIDVPEPEKSTPSFSNRRSGPDFPNPEEQTAYNNAYRQAYQESWRRAYRDEYRRSYRAEFRSAQNYGCQQARRRDYWNYYEEGQREGEREGRQREYNARYPSAFEQARQRAYQRAYDDTFQTELPRARKSVFETERQEAFEQREQEIYDAAFARAKQIKFEQDHPAIQKYEYDKGLSDEATDFAARPVRLLEASVLESIRDGVFEPGEDLFLRFSLRNFGANAINPGELKIVAQSSDGTVTQEAQINLGRELRGLSINEIGEALVFQLPEYSLKEEFSLTLKAFYQGVAVGEESLKLRANYSANIKLDKPQPLAEGLPRIYRVMVTNQSSQPFPADARLMVKTTDSNEFEFAPEAPLGSLSPGESRTVEFPVISRSGKASVTVPFDVRIEAGQRRIGREVAEIAFPVGNDYKVNATNNAAILRNAGPQRLYYQITNNSQSKGRALQVSVRFLGESATNFSLPGVNPQYLGPVAPGQTVTFSMPVNVGQPNTGGLVEIEVQEEGRPVVIRRVRF